MSDRNERVIEYRGYNFIAVEHSPGWRVNIYRVLACCTPASITFRRPQKRRRLPKPVRVSICVCHDRLSVSSRLSSTEADNV